MSNWVLILLILLSSCGVFVDEPPKEEKEPSKKPEKILSPSTAIGKTIVYSQPLPSSLWLVKEREGKMSILETCVGNMPGINLDMESSELIRIGRTWTQTYNILSVTSSTDTLKNSTSVKMDVLTNYEKEIELTFIHDKHTKFITVHGLPISPDGAVTSKHDTLFVDVHFWDHVTYLREQCFTR